MSIPDFQTLMLPLLRLSSAGEIAIGDAVRRLADEFSLSEDERAALLPSGRQATFTNRVHWAKTYLGKSGLVTATRRGRFAISQRGEQVLAVPPARIDIRYLEQFEEFQQFRARSSSDGGQEQSTPLVNTDPDTATPDEIMRGAHRQIEASLAQDLLDRVRGAPPAFFEQLIVKLLLAMGYGGSVAEAGRALGRSGDDGVDGVIDQDPLGLDRVYVQAKRYGAANPVGAGAVRDFFGSLDRHKAAKGLFVTTSAFTASARETAEYLSKRIVLVDGEQLGRMMVRHEVGCRVEEVLSVKKLDEEFFD